MHKDVTLSSVSTVVVKVEQFSVHLLKISCSLFIPSDKIAAKKIKCLRIPWLFRKIKFPNIRSKICVSGISFSNICLVGRLNNSGKVRNPETHIYFYFGLIIKKLFLSSDEGLCSQYILKLFIYTLLCRSLQEHSRKFVNPKTKRVKEQKAFDFTGDLTIRLYSWDSLQAKHSLKIPFEVCSVDLFLQNWLNVVLVLSSVQQCNTSVWCIYISTCCC